MGVRVEAYRYENGCICPLRHINSAFLTYDLASSRTNLPRFIPEREVILSFANWSFALTHELVRSWLDLVI